MKFLKKEPLSFCSFFEVWSQRHKTLNNLSAHNMDEVSDVCDRVLFLKQGQIVAADTPEGLAKTATTARMRLLVQDGLKRIARYASEAQLKYAVDDREIEVELEEKNVAQFLVKLADEKISYSQISINKPTLEDYFNWFSIVECNMAISIGNFPQHDR